jgi:tRNA A-37 threonylcarbamoyl transferase component Bud32
MYLVAASYLGYLIFLPYTVFTGPDLPPGFEFGFTGGGIQVKTVVPGSFWQMAGLSAGDRVVAVDGLSVRNIHEWQAMRANTEAQKPQNWELVRRDKPLVVSLSLPKGFWSAWRVGPAVVGFILVSFCLALLIAFRRPFDSTARWGAWLLATTPYAFGVWDGWAVTWRHLPSFLSTLLWVPQISRLILDGIALTFFTVFPTKLFKTRWPWVLIWIPVLVPLPWRVLGIYSVIYQPHHPMGAPEWVFSASSLRSVVYMAGAVAALAVNYWRLEDLNERRRLRFMALGMAVSLLSAMGFIFLQSRGVLLSSIWLATLGVPLQLLSMSFPLSTAYAILRHRFFDIRVMIRQGLQYALARGLLISLVPALGIVAVADLLVHGDQPLVSILSTRGWVYAALGGLAFVAYTRRRGWMEALDRRFFREHYDAQRLLREIAQEARQGGSLERAAPRVVARIEAALHPEFAAIMFRASQGTHFGAVACSPSGRTPPPFPAEGKLIGLLRLLGRPLEVTLGAGGWLQEQLPHQDTDFLRRARFDLLVPIAITPPDAEALLALGVKRSEEPYTREDQDLLAAIASSLALLLERPQEAPARVSEAFQECPECGSCYDTGAPNCAQEGSSLVPVRLPRLLAGRYRLDRRRGRGGMGAVYEATDTALERRVAVKLVREDLVGSAGAAERFRKEARATASFAHPNVVTVYDFGVTAETHAFLVMELLEGGTLREELVRDRRVAPGRTLEILRSVCSAIDAAHRRNLIHRDLKPENIFLAWQESGEVVKVLDFGIAKFLPTTTRDTADTGGVLMGTLPYTCPEQLCGETVHPGWDLWALAVVAYEMLTGARPFPGSSPMEWHRAILAGQVSPVSIHSPDAPESWQEFFDRAIALDPSCRPNSAAAFLTDLERALS